MYSGADSLRDKLGREQLGASVVRGDRPARNWLWRTARGGYPTTANGGKLPAPIPADLSLHSGDFGTGQSDVLQRQEWQIVQP